MLFRLHGLRRWKHEKNQTKDLDKMVKLVKDFTMKGKEEEIFLAVRDKLPQTLSPQEFNILEEIKEGNRLYRKALLRRESTLNMIPSVVKENLPDKFTRTCTCLVEETIFYEKERKLQFSITCEYDNVYSLSGSVRIVQLDDQHCKVFIILYFELHAIDKYITSDKVRSMVVPLLESKVPSVFIDNLRTTYQSVCE